MEKDNDFEQEIKTENEKAKGAEQSENGGLSPNERMFAGGGEVKKAQRKKPHGKLPLFIALAVVVAILAVSICVLVFSSALDDFIESRIMSPDEQLSAVLKREAEAAIQEHSSNGGNYLSQGSFQRTGSLDTRVDEEFLEKLERFNPLSFDLTDLALLNEIDLYYGVRAEDGGLTAHLNLAEDGSSLGATARYDALDGSAYLSIPLLSEALLGVQTDIDLSFLSRKAPELSEDDRQTLTELSAALIDGMLGRAGEITRERETIKGEKDVKCDHLSFSVDRDRAADILTAMAKTFGEEKYSQLLRSILPEGGYEILKNSLSAPEQFLPADLSLSVSFWINRGEVVGVNLSEKTTDSSFYRMEPTNVIEFSAQILGIPVKIGGEVKDGNGNYTVRSLMGIKVGKIVTEGFSFEGGVPDGTLTLTLSDEVVELGSALGEGILGGLLGDLGGYAIVLDFDGDETDFATSLSVKNGETELLYLGFDSTSDCEVGAFDPDGYEVYPLEDFEGWRKTVKVSGELLVAILNGPEYITRMIPEGYRGILAGASGLLPDGVLDFVLGGILDGYIDPILDKVQGMLPAKGE